MKILAIDTANSVCSVCFSQNGIPIAQKDNLEPSRQAELLFSIINEILQEKKLATCDINAIAANIGPGSFTGVRIGLAAARGFALAAKIPVIGVTSLEAMIYSAKKISIAKLNESEFVQNVFAVLDAGRGQVFMQQYSSGALSEAQMLNYSHAAKLAVGNANFTIIGNGASLIEPELILNEADYSIVKNPSIPDAGMIASVAYEKINSGNYTANPAPLYIREPDAKLPTIK